ncbi:MAG: NADH-quinone oxidoreductase subunit C [Acidimicrobiia bacterium]
MADEEAAATPEEPEPETAPDGGKAEDDAPAADEPAAPVLSEEAAELLTRLENELGDAVLEHAPSFGTVVVRVRPDAWARAAEVARDHLDCDYLSFVSGIDWTPTPREGDEAGGDTSAPVQPQEMTFGVAGSTGRFQVLARVQSTSKHWGITLKTDVDEAAPNVQSWVAVYPGADWHEREAWEMYGFVFDGHPHLRHLYLPTDFEGHPLRKDFPLLARAVKPWPGLVDVEAMPGDAADNGEGGDESSEAADEVTS